MTVVESGAFVLGFIFGFITKRRRDQRRAKEDGVIEQAYVDHQRAAAPWQ